MTAQGVRTETPEMLAFGRPCFHHTEAKVRFYGLLVCYWCWVEGNPKQFEWSVPGSVQVKKDERR